MRVVVLLLLPPSPASVRAARRAAGETVSALGRPDLVDDVTAVVSELVANAVMHAGTDVELSVERGGEGVRVAVSDGSPVRPKWTPAATTATSGRGLVLVQRLATVWGVESHDDGKTVWALLERSVEVPHDGSVEDLFALWAPDDAAPAALAPGEVAVVLTVDVAAMLESRGHTEDLTRELQLVLLDERTRPHAEPVAQLARRLSSATRGFEEGRRQILDQTLTAAQHGRTTVTLHLHLPREAADAARGWLAALDEADRLTDEGLLLLPPFPTAMVAFRREYIATVVSRLLEA